VRRMVLTSLLAWGLGEGLSTLYRKKKKNLVTKCYTLPRNLQCLVNTVMNFRILEKERNFLTELLLASQEGLCSVELVS
jgi:hypothetical protein